MLQLMTKLPRLFFVDTQILLEFDQCTLAKNYIYGFQSHF